MKLDPRALPSTDDIQRSLFQTLQEKRNVIVGGVLFLLLVAVAIVWYVKSKEAEQTDMRSRLYEATDSGDHEQIVLELEALIEDTPEDLRAYALLKLGQASFKAAQDPSVPDDKALDYLDRGLEALRRIERDHPDDPWNNLASAGDRDLTMVRSLMRKLNADRKWREEHRYVHPEVDREVTALIETSRGNIRIGFFPELAPAHVENFIDLAKTGFYNDLLVHGAYGGYWIKLGDPNTRNREDRRSHGKGGPGYSLDPEPARYRVRHLPGVISSEYMEGQESGSQFMICVSANEAYDKEQTPFAAVTEGLEVAEEISHVTTVARDRALQETDRSGLSPHLPTTQIVVHAISIWRDGEIDEGHTWDTSLVGKKRPAKPDRPPTDGATPSPELEKKLAGMMAEAAELEEAGKIREALDLVREVIKISPAYPDALSRATELAEKLED
jgi:peptidyl-prolyl cis-trans isomerase B (cyclophilin B)